MLLASALLVQVLLTPPIDSCAHVDSLRVRRQAGYVLAGIVEYIGPATARPAVLLIGGAGPTDRDAYTFRGSRGHNGAFRTIATRLVDAGYVVIRFDEVGTGRSTGDYATVATTPSLAADVRAVVDAARANPVVQSGAFFLLGYSEGATIAAMVASADTSIAGSVLLAAPSWKGSRIIAYQDSVAIAHNELGYGIPAAEAAKRLRARSDARARSDRWYRYALDFDPLPAVEHLRSPVLLLHGASDNQVSAAQAAELAAAFVRSGNPDVELRILPWHGHSLTDSDSRVSPPPVSPVVLDAVVRWLEARAPSSAAHGGCMHQGGAKLPAASPSGASSWPAFILPVRHSR